mgnify:CR=1 FL=1
MSNLTTAARKVREGTAAPFHWAILQKEWMRRDSKDKGETPLLAQGSPNEDDLVKLARTIGREATKPTPTTKGAQDGK